MEFLCDSHPDLSPICSDGLGIFANLDDDPVFAELLSELNSEYIIDEPPFVVDDPREEELPVVEVRLVAEPRQVALVLTDVPGEVDESVIITAKIEANAKRIAKLTRKNARLAKKLSGVAKKNARRTTRRARVILATQRYKLKPFVPSKCLHCQQKRHTTTKCDFRGVGTACGFCEKAGLECHKAGVDYRYYK